MPYVAQGTVQAKQHQEGSVDVLVDPIADYKVKHKDKEYTVLVEAMDDPNRVAALI